MKTLSLLLSLLALSLAPAHAAGLPASGRLTLDVKITGTGQTRGHEGKATFKTLQSAHLAFTVHPVADLEAVNRLDGAGTGQLYAQQAATQRMPSEAEAERFAAQMQKEAAACGSNVACLQKLGAKASKMTMTMTGATATPPAHAGEGRYLNFSAIKPEECRMEYAARIQDSVEGAIDDTQGPIPYAEHTRADFKGGSREAISLCQSMATLDMKTGKLWVLSDLPAPKGQVTRSYRSERNSVTPVDGIALHKEAVAWVFEQLRGKVTKSGSRKTSLRVPITLLGQKGEQVVEIEMRWTFETT